MEENRNEVNRNAEENEQQTNDRRQQNGSTGGTGAGTDPDGNEIGTNRSLGGADLGPDIGGGNTAGRDRGNDSPTERADDIGGSGSGYGDSIAGNQSDEGVSDADEIETDRLPGSGDLGPDIGSRGSADKEDDNEGRLGGTAGARVGGAGGGASGGR